MIDRIMGHLRNWLLPPVVAGLVTLAVLLATAIGFGSVGIFASALTKRTQSATVVTYCAVIGAILGSAMLFSFWQSVSRADDPMFLRPNGGAPEQIRFVNPMVAMLDVVANVEPPGGTQLTRPLYQIFGQDLTREDFRALMEGSGRIESGIFPAVEYSPQNHFGGESVHVLKANCGKGEPMQTHRVGHGAAPARFRNVRVGVGRW